MYYNIYIYVNDSAFYQITKHFLLHRIKKIKGIHKADFVKPDYDYIKSQKISDSQNISKIFACTNSGVSYSELAKIKRKLLDLPGIKTIKTSELEL